MGNILKVNFNNARIKLPTIDRPLTNVVGQNQLKLENPNTLFETCQMTVYINDEALFITKASEYLITIPDTYIQSTYQPTEEDIKQFGDIPACNFKLTVKVEGYSSMLYREETFTTFISLTVICSDNLVCSNNLTVRE